MKRFVMVLLFVIFLTQTVYAGESFRISNQGNKPWCAAYAVSNAIETQMIREGFSPPENGFDKNWIAEQCGENGIGIEEVLNIAITDGLKEYGGEKRYKITTYSAINVDDSSAIVNAISSGAIVIINSKCKKSDWKDGNITDNDTLAIVNLHATYLYAVESDITAFGVNSWGDDWGNKGKIKVDIDWLMFPNVLGAYIFTI